MSLPNFSWLLSQVTPTAPQHYRAQIDSSWMQGRATFGGLIGALAMRALRLELGEERPLRALMTAFVGPAGEGEVEIRCETLRSGKSVTWAEIRMSQEGKPVAVLTACLGGNRESKIVVEPESRPAVKPPEEGVPFKFIPGITPNFTQHYEMRWATGKLPMSGSEESAMGVWLRFKEAKDFSEAHIVALMDVLPPAVLQMFKQMKPISSLSWHLELLDDLNAADALDGEGWWYFDVFAHAAANGYSQQHATLYTPRGRAIAMSQQAIAVFG